MEEVEEKEGLLALQNKICHSYWIKGLQHKMGAQYAK
jgi:hypothetical protein